MPKHKKNELEYIVPPPPPVYVPPVEGSNPKKPKAVAGNLSPSQRKADPQAWARTVTAAPKPGELYVPFKKASGEHVISHGDAYVVWGKDRPSTAPSDENDPEHVSGYFAETNCSMIDVVVGRLGYRGPNLINVDPRARANPDFELDAARIYICERTDVDDNLGPHWTRWLGDDHLNKKSGGDAPARNKSAIVVKADGVRIVARESIKLITMTDSYNSGGQLIEGRYGIDLIAGVTDSDKPNSNLQPLVKGNNMTEAMMALAKSVHEIDTQVTQLNTMVSDIVGSLTTHIHLAPGFGAPSSPDVNPISIAGNVHALITNAMQIVETNVKQFNHASFQKNYLTPGVKTWICSTLNKTT